MIHFECNLTEEEVQRILYDGLRSIRMERMIMEEEVMTEEEDMMVRKVTLPEMWERKLQHTIQVYTDIQEDYDFEQIFEYDYNDLLVLFEQISSQYNMIVETIHEYEAQIKHNKFLEMKRYEQKGVKAIKTREQMVADDFTKVTICMSELKRVRADLELACTCINYLLQRNVKVW